MNTLDFDHIWMLSQLLISALSKDFTLIHYHYLVSKVHIIDSVGHQYPRLVFKKALKDILKYSLARLGI